VTTIVAKLDFTLINENKNTKDKSSKKRFRDKKVKSLGAEAKTPVQLKKKRVWGATD
jgi:hypothetical protein